MIVVSASHTAERDAAALGAKDVLMKPFDLPHLLDLVTQPIEES